MSSINGRNVSDGRLDFSQQLLEYATRDRPKIDFLSDLLSLVLKYSRTDAVEIRLNESGDVLRCEATRTANDTCVFRIMPDAGNVDSAELLHTGDDSGLERLCRSMLDVYTNPGLPSSTKYGSFWTGDTSMSLLLNTGSSARSSSEQINIGGSYRSLVIIPLRFGAERIGLLLFKNKQKNQYDDERIEYLETITAKFELALLHHHSQAKLHERVKELTCLYGISQIASDTDKTFARKIMDIITLLPPAWQYPGQACARIILDGKTFKTRDFKDGKHKQSARICVRDKKRGMVEVHYTCGVPSPQGDPFLEEEQNLINNIAGQIALMIEQRETEAIKSELQTQLIRADRLAAIGQLAAGVAHELNEPLNTILGFAQLVQKTTDMNKQTMEDIQKITDASLHARRIIRELLIFARQAKPSRIWVNLNRIIGEELSLFESLCKKSGVELLRVLDPDLPEIVADKSQMLQVLSNLVVNALQAMPDGGELMIQTSCDHSKVSLIISDTGIGMNDEVKENIFVPFFTTKDVDQGTGLGLAVVHGIVTSHGGNISVESVKGQGSRFQVNLPRKQGAAKEEIKEDDSSQ